MIQAAKPVASIRIQYTGDYWMSYSDLMAGVLMVFILILLMALQQLGEAVERQIGVSERIIMALRDRFAQSDAELAVDVDPESGAIRFGEDIFFSVGSSQLSPDGQSRLDDFFPVYSDVLLGNEEFRQHLSQIIIEGHTDSDGSYLSNLGLSQRRASAVAEYLLRSSTNSAYHSELEFYITANGRSESHPIATNETKEGKSLNRRIEFKFRLKDEQALERLRALLTGG